VSGRLGRGGHADNAVAGFRDPIWLDDPAYPGLKKSIGPIIGRGLTLCD
jgi:hypothetical protein